MEIQQKIFQASRIKNIESFFTEIFRLFYILYLKFLAKDKSIIVKYDDITKVNIDVLIPLIERDLDVAKYTIRSLRQFSLNEIMTIFIVAPYSEKIVNFANQNNCTFINENSATDILKESIDYKINGENRSGWLFQQILKLNWDKISSNKFCLIFDADTFLIKPQAFVSNNKINFNCSNEFHIPYYKVFCKLIGFKTRLPISFVAHYMIFERDTTLEMKSFIEKKHKLPWEKAILTFCDYNSISGFSEYETYGHFMYNFYRKLIQTNYWFNVTYKKKSIISIWEDKNKISKKYKSVSLHWHN